MITIADKKILYWDKLQGKLWGTSLQYLPPDPSNNLKIINSRNKIPSHFINLLTVPQEELEEYSKANNDEDLLKLVQRDAIKNMCRIVEIKRT